LDIWQIYWEPPKILSWLKLPLFLLGQNRHGWRALLLCVRDDRNKAQDGEEILRVPAAPFRGSQTHPVFDDVQRNQRRHRSLRLCLEKNRKTNRSTRCYNHSQSRRPGHHRLFLDKGRREANFNKGYLKTIKSGEIWRWTETLHRIPRCKFQPMGHQLTVGGSNRDDTPFYNSIKVDCLRAARTIHVNAPCLGLRLHPQTPRAIIKEAAKAILTGGAHPILLNDEKIISGLRQSGNYNLPKSLWEDEKSELIIDGKVVEVPY
jgi:hypothetical protein